MVYYVVHCECEEEANSCNAGRKEAGKNKRTASSRIQSPGCSKPRALETTRGQSVKVMNLETIAVKLGMRAVNLEQLSKTNYVRRFYGNNPGRSFHGMPFE